MLFKYVTIILWLIIQLSASLMWCQIGKEIIQCNTTTLNTKCVNTIFTINIDVMYIRNTSNVYIICKDIKQFKFNCDENLRYLNVDFNETELVFYSNNFHVQKVNEKCFDLYSKQFKNTTKHTIKTIGAYCSVNNCETCYFTDRTKCQTCFSNFSLINSTTCRPCNDFSNCETCSSTSARCKICKTDFYDAGNTTGPTCLPCPTNCLVCTNLKGCERCVDGYYLNGTTCTKCDPTCSQSCLNKTGACLTCNENYVKSLTNSSQCVSCSSFDINCESCIQNERSCYKCNRNYYPGIDGKCVLCHSSCVTGECNTVNGKCNTCANNYTKYILEQIECQKCQEFDNNCNTCSVTTRKCIKCKIGFRPDIYYPNNCIPCNETCLNKCDTKNGACTSCITGYVLTTVSSSNACELCENFDQNCETCEDNGIRICKICKTGFRINPSTGMCINCDSYCTQCISSTGICTRCSDGYTPKLTLSTSCELCTSIERCLTCSTTERKCITCSSGYYVLNGFCKACSATCGGMCDPITGDCTGCISNYVFSKTDSKICETCGDYSKECVTCSTDFQRKCVTCSTEYYPDADGNCVTCSPTCICDSTTGFCTSCQPNYVLQNQKSRTCELCSSFDPNCQTCSSDSSRRCVTCNSGCYINTNYYCVSCDSTCGGKCQNTTGYCTGCIENYVLTTTSSTICLPCSTFDNNCLQCASDYSRKCTKCGVSNMYPDERTFICKTCDSTCNGGCDQSTGICTTCLQNYVFTEPQSKSCVSCNTFDPNCLKCNSNFNRRCSVCKTSYYPNSNGICILCSLNCTYCNQSNGICTQCKQNYVFKTTNSAECVYCKDFDANCKSCFINSDRLCYECESGYYPGINKICTKCDDTCGGKCNAMTGYCTGCNTGYVPINSVSLTCQSCSTFDSNCLECTTDFKQICKTCSSGKYPSSSGTCQECDKSCGGQCNGTTGICTGCLDNYVFYDDKTVTCQSCSLFYNKCLKCATDYSRKCIECQPNNYLSNNICLPCDSTCKSCDGKTGQCTSCNQNHVYSGNKMSCVPCSTYDTNCLTCSTSFEKICTTCINNKYPDKITGQCIACSIGCQFCDGTTGNCTRCGDNFVNDESTSNGCVSCFDFDNNCVRCASDKSRKCEKCTTKYYPSNNYPFKCINCSSTCGGMCDPTTGDCTGCISNYVFSDTDLKICESCTNYSKECVTCSTDFQRKCITCSTGYYPDADGNCVTCSPTCICDSTTGFCTSCKSNYVHSTSDQKVCETCASFDPNCITCSSDSSRRCVTCNSGFYPKQYGDFKCQKCDTSCKTCSSTTGYCSECATNQYTLNNDSSISCDLCSSYDSNCSTCSTTQRGCSVCKENNYLDIKTKHCSVCDNSCNYKCNKENGICDECITNYVFTEPNSKICISCNTFDVNCKTCSADFARKCIECSSGYYPNLTGRCVQCSTINFYCNSCDSKKQQCLDCINPYYLKSENSCLKCPEGTYKNTTTSCKNCFEKIPNCRTCEGSEIQTRCTSCYAPYTINTRGNCVLCNYPNYYIQSSNTNGSCEMMTENCDIQININMCVKCKSGSFLSEYKCKNTTNCTSSNILSLNSCDCVDQISINSDCCKTIPNCKYLKIVKSKEQCLNCNDNYILTTDQMCTTKVTSGIYRNGVYYQCKNIEYLNYFNSCTTCGGATSVCVENNNKINYLNCANKEILDVEKALCITDINCTTVTTNFCSKCIEINSLYHGICVSCQTKFCSICYSSNANEKCMKCMKDYLMISNNWCIHQTNVGCIRSTSVGCIQCKNEYYQVDTTNTENKYDFCLPISTLNINNCKHVQSSLLKCVECLDSYKLKNGICAENFEQDDINETSFNQKYQFEYFHTNYKNQIKSSIETICVDRTNKGCIHCLNGFYYNHINTNDISGVESECVPCVNNCKTCYNSTLCTSCLKGYYLNSLMECQSLGELSVKCNLTLPTGGGCAICNDGYYKFNSDCKNCDKSCLTCFDATSCLSCNTNYYRLSTTQKLCLPFSEMLNCENKTEIGCSRCLSEYYELNHICYKCIDNCISCEDANSCEKCKEKDYVLLNKKCVHYTEIEHCLSASHSKCTTCDRNKKISDDGVTCLDSVNYGVIVGVPITIIIVLIIVITVGIIITIFFIIRHKEKIETLNICVFQMNRSNIVMSSINKNICCNKKTLRFNLDSDDLLPVDEETRDLICIGNTSKHEMKIQFSVVEGCDYYDIRTVPNIITLKRGFACEFELFIKPLCSCQMKEEIRVIGLDLQTCKEYIENIHIECATQNTTKLNYRELQETKQIGEGSFGVVMIGTFRDNKVAIKKMKSVNKTPEQLKEFEKEVSMLDKFRNEYIIHFYGACFITNHICMVTEFAQYGSLQDLIKKKSKNEINLKMRVKLILDASKGLLYLHENGVLHRDIKPDNILVLNLDYTQKVSGKLTDFGSSRNINMMMTNMTFTKGIGTPKYMAQEVLNKEHYKKPADVFSLAVSLFECLIWEEIYPKEEFKFAWSIADFITSGKRIVKPLNMDESIYNVISKMWAVIPQERPTMDLCVEFIERYFNNI
ncbi:protein serine/threonine kinase, putative [Entamoeba invadens IP1]|uniref:Protein serine/threonine kinase, putative n=1 Tax=Entamoeba invadens IP1 TaxID=370355 RepID=A0A0A1TUT1_ENTIV|nr:protein serine/threonine kinase, putative [Entamoeba invadens IP1]ELP83904.1 protein serine/threonine kinase, putative [Entamoeba invadens IP1]|eukprot:XP_004183250.1 protein serine/threonine kinase, putative [Entamoeba invadens IP1]